MYYLKTYVTYVPERKYGLSKKRTLRTFTYQNVNKNIIYNHFNSHIQELNNVA